MGPMGLMGLMCSFCHPAQTHGAAASPFRPFAVWPFRPTRRFAKKAPAGFSTERAPLSYHATLLRLTVAFLNGNVMTAGLAIPHLH
jgi:hypothetical protein